MRRVRVLRLPLSDYDRMACEWGYVHNSEAGEDIRVFELTCDDSSQVARSAQSAEDFYVLDQHIALLMDYTDDGEFSGAEKTSAAGAFEELAGMYWLAAEPFEQWWAAHPEYHRNTVGR
jgi:hypothetical protein